MVDIHMHIIPGVDDGARSFEMAEAMLRSAAEQGIHTVFATSHGDAFCEKGELVSKRFEQLKKLVKDKKIPIQLYMGSEVYCDSEDMHLTLKYLKEGIIPSMNGTKYVLSEFYWPTKEEMRYCLGELLREGWIPIVAHMERYRCVDLAFAKELKQMGCKIQINVYSVFEEEKESTKARARMLLDNRLVDFVGSDAHRTDHRPVNVESGIKYL